MARRVEYEIPAGLKEARQRFDEWRGSRSGRRPIPEVLWYHESGPVAKSASVPQPSLIELIDLTTPAGWLDGLTKNKSALGRNHLN